MRMSEKKPLVSIVASSYNFEKFIPYFIESVLRQTYPNWELIITDDCSTDRSMEVLKRYEAQDPRIRVFQNDKNRHVSHTLNNSLRNAHGEYLCLMSCDDVFLPEKLSHDVAYMEQHTDIGVLYGQLQQIDEYGSIQKYSYVPPERFDQKALLRTMYLEGNACVSPGMFLRKSVADTVGYFHPLLRMTQDYEYHVRLLFVTKPAFNAVPLIQYRRMSDNTNLSSTDDERTINAEYNETFFILENYLKHIREYAVLKEVFPEVVRFGSEDNRSIPYYLGRLALTSPHSHVQAFGIETLFRFMSLNDNSRYLEQSIGFLPKDFMSLISRYHVYHSLRYPSQYSVMKKIRKKMYRFVVRIFRILKRSLRNI